MTEPGVLPSMGLHRVRHDRSDLAAAAKEEMHRGVLGGSQMQSFCILRTHHPLETLISPTSKLIQASDIQHFIEISLWRHD